LVRDADIGDQTKHAGNLKASHEEIERSPVVVRVKRGGHEASSCPVVAAHITWH
jgi:hypothetical protein